MVKVNDLLYFDKVGFHLLQILLKAYSFTFYFYYLNFLVSLSIKTFLIKAELKLIQIYKM